MDATAFALFSTVAFVAWCWIKERSTFVRQIEQIPGPSFKLPIIGNLLSFPRSGNDMVHWLLVRWVKQYGPIYRIWRGSQPLVLLSSPEAVEQVFSSQININKSPSSTLLTPWIGYGLLLSNGNKWKEDRRMLTPAFHFQILNDFFEVYNRNSAIFIDQITNKLLSSGSSEIDVAPMVSHCTLDIICEAAMGIEVNAQIECNSEYIKATEGVTRMIQQRANSLLGILPNWVYLNFTYHGRTFQKLLDIVHGFTAKVLKERREELALDEVDETKKRKPFLQLLIESAHRGANLTDEDIMNQVDTFMFEGHDTTAAAITWFLYCMASNQHEQERVYKEIYDCFGDSDRPCNMEDLPKLKYLECCIKETMRLYPSVPFFRRQLLEAMKFNGYTIPAGATVQMQVYSVHHDEKHFPDPYSYKPERFLPEQSAGRHPYAYVPFSAGPRNCIGLKFATYEDKVVLTNLLRKFRFDIDPRHVPARESINLILKPEGGMPLIITPRY